MLRQPFVLAELCLGLFALPAFIGDIADPEHALRMVENPFGIIGGACQQFAGGPRRLPERDQRRLAIAAQVAHLADQMQRATATTKGGCVEIGRFLPGIIF